VHSASKGNKGDCGRDDSGMGQLFPSDLFFCSVDNPFLKKFKMLKGASSVLYAYVMCYVLLLLFLWCP